eukprot:Skav230699  [mRNA]  locus=scaffold1495:145031:146830:+ [translate_table: standard]
MASASSKPSKRQRIADRESDFFSCAGLPVDDVSLRKITARLRNDKSIETASRWRSEATRWKHQLETICSERVALPDGDEVELFATDLQRYMDQMREKQPRFMERVEKTLLQEHANKPEGIDGIIYLDGVVPGNILAPDNKRKSYCVYFTWRALASYRSTNIWFTVSVLRNSQADLLPGGLPEFLTRIVRMLRPFLLGLVLPNEQMIVTKTLFLIADEAALKQCSGSKGASGLRPCIHCDAFSKDHEDLAQRVGSQSIACADFSLFRAHGDNDILEILDHLKEIKNNQSRSALEEAQKLLGWTYNEFICFIQTDLQQYLKPSHFHYDSMHCYWSNGQVNCEVGLFFSAACRIAGLSRNQLETYFKSNWQRNIGSGNLENLFSQKLLKMDSDYKGDADQTMEILPLLAYFATEMFSDHEEFLPHVASLQALWHVAAQILDAKHNIDHIHGLTVLQRKHLQFFTEVYGPERIRPKHHFAGHIEAQALESGILLDCFPGERKNQVFKHTLAPRISRLHGFEKAILLRWLETDIEKMGAFTGEDIILKAQVDCMATEEARIAKHLQCQWGEINAGRVLLFDKETAMQVIGCMRRTLDVQHVPHG